MFPTLREFVLFLLLVVGVPLLIAAGLPFLAWKLRSASPAGLSVMLVVQCVATAGLAAIAAGPARTMPTLPLVAAGFLLSTLVSFGLAVGRAPMPVLVGAGVVLVLGGVVAVRSRLAVLEDSKADHERYDALTLQIDECRSAFQSSVEPKQPLPEGWTSTWGTTFDGVEYRLKGPFQAELMLSCAAGQPTVQVTLDGAEDELAARLRDLDALPPLVESGWLLRARAELEQGRLRLQPMNAAPEVRRCVFIVSIKRPDAGS